MILKKIKILIPKEKYTKNKNKYFCPTSRDHKSALFTEIAKTAEESVEEIFANVPGSQFVTLADIK